jgi:iron complex outermembrane receptor protein
MNLRSLLSAATLSFVLVAGAAAQSGTPPVVLDQVEVTGTRIRGVLAEAGVSPLLSFTRDEITRLGIGSLGDLKQLIPQLSVGNATAFNGNTSGNNPTGRVTFTLRGISGNATLVLVNGRRLPVTAQALGGDEPDYDLAGIPLDSIERVDVLLDGASSIYGADAVGGVINIVLRREYSGGEAELSYDNPFDTDAAVTRASFRFGHRAGRLRLSVSGSHQTQNALASRDRRWLATLDRRPLGGTDGRSQVPAGSGRVRTANGANLPGLTSSFAAIPANSNGRAVTVADYAAAGAVADRFDSALYSNAVNAGGAESAAASLEYEFRPWLQAFLDVRAHRFEVTGLGDPPQLSGTSLPANYPGNPFGVPIVVDKVMWELGFANRSYGTETLAVSAGVRGMLPRDFRYEASANWSRSEPELDETTGGFLFTPLNAAINNPVAEARPVLLHNSLNGPANPPGALEALFFLNPRAEISRNYTYDFKLDGPVARTWAGPVQAAVGGEIREDYADFERLTYSVGFDSDEPPTKRLLKAAFGEVGLPLVAERQGIPLVNQLNATAALRHDRYNSGQSATTPRFGVTWRPFKGLLLRGTASEGFKMPTLNQLYRREQVSTLNFFPGNPFGLSVDPARNNEPVTGLITRTTGGNPRLKPEESESANFGVVVEVPFVKGLSLSADFWRVEMVNRITAIPTRQELLAVFPELFGRGPALGDGLPGRIVSIDERLLNIAFFNTSGRDFQVRYVRDTPWGEIDWRTMVTETTRYESIPRPGAVPTSATGLSQRPLRLVSNLNWYRQGLGLGLTAIHQEAFRTTPTAVPFDAYVLWDARVSYDFAEGRLHPRNSRVGRWLEGVRVSLSIVNVLDEEPPLTSVGLPNPAIDPRLRRYILSLRYKF